MNHSNGHAIRVWGKGDQLTADSLNGNFLKLYEMVIEALAAARMPDPANVALEMKTGRLAERVEGLEKLTAMHAHQRNEAQYTPLSYHAAVITMVNDLRQELEKAVAWVDELYASLRVDYEDLQARVLGIQDDADASRKEQLAVLVGDQERMGIDLRAARAEIVELRHELSIVRNIAQGNDREANRMQYAPLAYVGSMLQRIEQFEARLKAMETDRA